MTHIEAKSVNLAHGGQSEISGEVETLLSPEALALFSSLFLQWQSEIDPTAVTTGQSARPSKTSPVSDAAMSFDITSNQKNLVVETTNDVDGIDLGGIGNLTELLIAAQQIVGNGSTLAQAPTASIDKAIFSDTPIPETTAIANQLMQRAAAAILKQKQSIDGTEGSRARGTYDSEALSNPELINLLRAAMKPAFKEFGERGLPHNDMTTAAPKAIVHFDPEVSIDTAFDILPSDAVTNALHGPPQPSGQGPIPAQLAKLVQGPPQKSGQGPAVPQVIKHLQGPPLVSGEGPMMPELANQLHGPPQPSVQRPLSIQYPLAAADRLAARPLKAQPVITQSVTSHDNILLDDAAVPNTNMTECPSKSGLKTEIEFGQRMPHEQRSNRLMTFADTNLEIANRAASEKMTTAHMGNALNRTIIPTIMLDPLRHVSSEAPSDSNSQSMHLATSSASNTHQHGSQSGGNAFGQQGRNAQSGIDSGAKNAGGERVAVYRLNVQQNGWADTMVRRLQTSLQNGSGAVRIILEPRNLGRLQVSMGLRDGRAAIRIAANTNQAASLLHDSRAQLAQMFEQSGLRLTSMQTTAAIINGDGSATADGGGSQMSLDQQTSGQNANKDGNNSERDGKLLSGNSGVDDIEIDTITELGSGETAVLNVLA